MKKTIVLVLLAVSCLQAQAQNRTRQTREEYIDRYRKIAVDHMERYGIPASIIMAQGILESDCGNSQLSRSSNNHFGIKCKSNWTGRKVYHDDDEKGECFRAYDSVEDSYIDHAEFLDSQPRYDSLFNYAPDDYKSWARGLKAAGYATAPDYAQRLVRIIEESELYLLDGDGADGRFTGQSSVETATVIDTVDPDDYRVTVNAHKGYNIYRTNEVNYIVARDGDTFEQIAVDFRISARNLRKFNDVAPDAQPVAGENIFIGRKGKRWESAAGFHTVREGETIWSIGQFFGIRSRSLERMNKIKSGQALPVGTTIRLR